MGLERQKGKSGSVLHTACGLCNPWRGTEEFKSSSGWAAFEGIDLQSEAPHHRHHHAQAETFCHRSPRRRCAGRCYRSVLFFSVFPRQRRLTYSLGGQDTEDRGRPPRDSAPPARTTLRLPSDDTLPSAEFEAGFEPTRT